VIDACPEQSIELISIPGRSEAQEVVCPRGLDFAAKILPHIL
jgi:hypothetical protein